MYQKILLQLRQAQTVASFCWGNDGVQVGKVLGWNDDEILIAHITAGGYYDGYVLRTLCGLSNVTFGGKYEQKIEKLYLKKEQKHHFAVGNNGTLWDSILQYAQQEKLVVTAESGSESVTGYIAEWDDATLILQVLDSYGENDGYGIVLRDQMDLLAVDTDYEQDLKLL